MHNLTAVMILALQTSLPKVDQQRIADVTKDIVDVIETEYEAGNYRGSLTKNDAIALLSAAVAHESGFKIEVETCKMAGDGGKSIGLGQVMIGQNWEGHTRKEICSDRKLQLRLAHHVMTRCWERTPRASSTLRCYTSGDAGKGSDVAKKQLASYMKFKDIIDESLKDQQNIDDVDRSISRKAPNLIPCIFLTSEV